MKNKIGRNSLCPCGSGKKYKKCCISIHSGNFKDWIKTFNSWSMIGSLGRLQIEPCNFSYISKYQEAISLCFANEKNNSKQKINFTDVDTFIKKTDNFSSERILESTSLFTQNMPFMGSNYIVYPDPELNENRSLFRIFLSTLEIYKNKIPDEILMPITGLLILSNTLARAKLNHSKNMKHTCSELTDLDPQTYGATIFSEEKINDMLEFFNLEESSLKHFVIDYTDYRLRKSWSPNYILYFKPIVKYNDLYIIAYPTAFLSAIRHFLFLKFKELGLLKDLISKFRTLSIQRIDNLLRQIDFEKVELGGALDFGKDPAFEEKIYKFDTDKICILQVYVDECSDYDENSVYKTLQGSHWLSIMKERRDKLSEGLSTFFPRHKVMSLKVFTGVGRGNPNFSFDNEANEHLRNLVTRYEDLDFYLMRDSLDNLDLWNLLECRDIFEQENILYCESFLDLSIVFESHNESLYMSDDSPKVILPVKPNLCKAYIEEIITSKDFQYAPYTRNQFALIEKLSKNVDGLYVMSDNVGHYDYSKLCLKNFSTPIWLNINSKFDFEIDAIIRCIRFWFNEMHSKINEALEKSKYKSTIQIEIYSPPETNGESSYIRIENEKVIIENTERIFLDGDKIFIFNLINCIKSLFSNLSLELDISDSDLEKHFLNPNKKIFQSFTCILDADLSHLKPFKKALLKQYNYEKSVGDLVPRIKKFTNELNYDSKIPSEKNHIVVQTAQSLFLERIDSIIANINKEILLCKLIENNEYIVGDRNLENRTSLSSALISNGINERAIELNRKEKSLWSENGLTIRFLIEYIMGSKLKGTAPEISDYDYNELQGNALSYINYGFIGDYIRNKNIFENEFEFLPSGRLEIKNWERLRLTQLGEMKALERIEGYIDTTSTANENLSIEDILEKEEVSLFLSGFKLEFGIDFEIYTRISAEIIMQGIDEIKNYIKIPRTIALKSISTKLQIAEEEVNTFFENFSLIERNNWSGDLPIDCDQNDILPWIFKRRLSFNKKPFLLFENQNETFILYGFRQVLTSLKRFSNDLIQANLNDEHYPNLKEFFGKVKNKRGRKFEDEVVTHLKNHSSEEWLIHGPREDIAPDKKLNAEKNYGDVDIFIFNRERKYAYIIDCKNLLDARTPREIDQELKRLVYSPRSDIFKHLERFKWLSENWEQVISLYGLVDGEWKLVPYMMFRSPIPTTIIKKSNDLKLETVSFSEIKRYGIDVINKKNSPFERTIITHRKNA